MKRQFEKRKNALAVFLTGELDQYAASELKSKIDVEMENSGKKNLIIDLSGVSLMDSSGIGLIVGRYKNLKPLGGRVCVSGGKNGVKKVVELSGITKIIPYFDDVNQADESLKEEKGRNDK